MNKARLETLSDSIFAVAMTLLIFDIKVPSFGDSATNTQLWHSLAVLSPHIIVYAGTFIVLSTMWINHHFLFQIFANEETVDRRINLFNLVYLMFIAFVPFSASFIGTYSAHQPAVILYGLNLLAITLLAVLLAWAINHAHGREHLSERMINQSRFRLVLNILCYLIALAVSFWNVYVSIFFYIFPVIFNFVPGTLNATERLLGFDFGEH